MLCKYKTMDLVKENSYKKKFWCKFTFWPHFQGEVIRKENNTNMRYHGKKLEQDLSLSYLTTRTVQIKSNQLSNTDMHFVSHF